MNRLWIVMLAVTVLLTGCGGENASVGVIGGADGPTAILVAGPEISSGVWIGLGVSVACAIGAIAFGIAWRRKNRK